MGITHTGEGWSPEPVEVLAAAELQVIDVDLGRDTVVLKRGQEIKVKVNWLTFGDIRMTTERPAYIRIRLA